MKRRHAQLDHDEAMTGEQVRAYLFRHPTFFADQSDLLELLHVPHASGAAVSLVSRQLDIYREKNRKLQKKFNDLVQVARENDDLGEKIHALTLALLDARTFQEGIASLEHVLRDRFGVDFVALRFLGVRDRADHGDVFVHPHDRTLEPFARVLQSQRPRCGRPAQSQAALLFAEKAREVLSWALVPMAHAGLCGLLAMGSRDRHRFHPCMDNLFLKRMGQLAAARLYGLLLHPGT